MMRTWWWMSAVVLMQLSTAARGDELSDLRARLAQLEATVEELTLQLADSVKERRRLELELADAVATAAAAVDAPGTVTEVAATRTTTVATGVPKPPASADDGITETAVVSAAVVGADTADTADTTGTAGTTAAQEVATAGSTYARNADCDVLSALDGYKGNRKGNEALEAWLQADDHLKRCSTEQLQQIRDAVKWDWLGYEKPVLKLLDKELARR